MECHDRSDRSQSVTDSRLLPSPFAIRVGIGFLVLAMLAPAAALAQYLPEQVFEFQNLGNSMGFSSAAGDVNGDGRDDLVLGAVFDDSFITATGTHVCNAGAVTIITGGTSNPPTWQLVADILNPDGEEDAAFGFSVAVGDINSDGKADVIVGSPLSDPSGLTNAGSVFVYIAPNFSSFAARFNGENSQDNLGTSVAATGDIDGDGRNDFVVGAPRFDPPGLTNAGKVYGIRLALQGVLDVRWTTNGQAAGELFGRSVDGGGRLVAGGPRRDVLAGAPKSGAGLGKARGLSGSDGAILGTANAPSGTVRFGEAVRFLPDINADGLDDSLVGIPGSDQVSLYLTMGGSPQWTLTGPAASEFGASIAVLMNIAGDSGVEFAVGAPSFSTLTAANAGRVRVFQPVGTGLPSQYLELTGSASGDRFGFSLARANVVGSGTARNDLVVGAPFADGANIAESGVVSAYDITTLPETQLASLAGTFSGVNYGEAVAFRRAGTIASPVEDWIVIGMPSGDLPAPLGTVDHTCDAGRVFVHSGDGVFRYSLPPGGPNERFGSAVAAVNSATVIPGDASDEFLVVGAPRAVAVSSGVQSGAIRIFNAESGALLCEHSPDLDEPLVGHLDADYGAAIARLGDVILDVGGGPDDGEEIAVGAPLADTGFVNAGKVYVYTVRSNPCDLLLRAVLIAPAGLDRTGAEFGAAVAGPGNLDAGLAHPPAEILVGAPFQTRSAMQAIGEAYIFEADAAGIAITAAPRATLVSGNPLATSDDRFGQAISGAGTITGAGPDFVAVGVPGGDTAGGLSLGRVEIFTNTGAFVVTVPNPTTTPGTAIEAFGYSLAEVDPPGTDADGFLVGNPAFFDGTNTPGEAYFFQDPALFSRIPYSDPLPPSLAAEIIAPEFGVALAHSPSTLNGPVGRSLISAISRDVLDAFDYRASAPRTHVNLGRVYLFRFRVQTPRLFLP